MNKNTKNPFFYLRLELQTISAATLKKENKVIFLYFFE